MSSTYINLREDNFSPWKDLPQEGCWADDWVAWCCQAYFDRGGWKIVLCLCNSSNGWRHYMTRTSMWQLNWRMYLRMKRRQITMVNGVWWLSCSIFTNKSNMYIDMKWFQTMWDLNKMSKWSWDEMELSYLYHYLFEAITFW